MWTHGKHPFDNSDKDDLALIGEMQQKRKKATEENLNYFEYFGNDFEGFRLLFETYLKKNKKMEAK